MLPRISRSRYWVFTLNNPDASPDTFLAHCRTARQFRFVIFQEEEGENGTRHYQGNGNPAFFLEIGYLGLTNERDHQFVRRNYSDRAHWEPRRGSHQQAIGYVTKEDTRVAGPFSIGDIPEQADQGSRTDIAAAVDLLRKGGLKRVAQEAPDALVKYPRGFTLLAQFLPPPERTLPTIKLYYGSTGCGKTRKAMDDAAEAGLAIYKHEPRSDWFDGYIDQPIFLLDEYSGWWKLDYLLSFLDRYVHRVAIKGSHNYLQADTIIITTNIHPCQWYNYTNRLTQYEAISRRISEVRIWHPRESVLTGSELVRFWSIELGGPLVNDFIKPM